MKYINKKKHLPGWTHCVDCESENVVWDKSDHVETWRCIDCGLEWFILKPHKVVRVAKYIGKKE